jgi:hypothetical protein
MAVVYTAVQRFDPACGECWHGLIEGSGLKQLRQVVTLTSCSARPSSGS